MDDIFTAWHLKDFPENARIPSFKFACAVGPKFVESVFEALTNEHSIIEKIDFDTGDSTLSLHCNVRWEGGDFLYLSYIDAENWVYIVSTDLDWGVIYSNIDPNLLISSCYLDKARENFEESYVQRTNRDQAYYNRQKLLAWATAAGIRPD